jgi:hypothetical protein
VLIPALELQAEDCLTRYNITISDEQRKQFGHCCGEELRTLLLHIGSTLTPTRTITDATEKVTANGEEFSNSNETLTLESRLTDGQITATLPPYIKVEKGAQLNYGTIGTFNYYYASSTTKRSPAEETRENVQHVLYSVISVCAKSCGIPLEPSMVKFGIACARDVTSWAKNYYREFRKKPSKDKME